MADTVVIVATWITLGPQVRDALHLTSARMGISGVMITDGALLFGHIRRILKRFSYRQRVLYVIIIALVHSDASLNTPRSLFFGHVFTLVDELQDVGRSPLIVARVSSYPRVNRSATFFFACRELTVP